jgi:succinate dehydrogenase / fumarate reductase, cytochrome b subunit
MSNLFNFSIGKKVIMSITGLFLIVFLLIHLTVNLMILFGQEAYNVAAHFMATNPAIKIIEPLLGLGFLFHIIYATVLTLQNRKARPQAYAVRDAAISSTWQSRNMYVLGALVLTFLAIHLSDFYIKIKFGAEGAVPTYILHGTTIDDTYTLVIQKFNILWFSIIYIIGAILLGLHLSHGFWSSFQSIGMSNDKWRNRLHMAGMIYAYLIAIGFSILPLYVLLGK